MMVIVLAHLVLVSDHEDGRFDSSQCLKFIFIIFFGVFVYVFPGPAATADKSLMAITLLLLDFFIFFSIQFKIV